MPRYSPADLTRRLRLDERTMALVNLDPAPVSVSAHATATDAYEGVRPIEPNSTDAPPEHYRVVYAFPTLKAKGVFHEPTVVHFDLLGNGADGYPFKEPICRVVGPVVPWTPHFHPRFAVCIGAGWTRDGRTLAVDLVVHIQKLLNFAEPKPTPGYDGWNAEAIRWWTTEHDCRPLDPDLRYPVIDPNRAPEARAGRFQPLAAGGSRRFSPAGAAGGMATPAGWRFSPVGGNR